MPAIVNRSTHRPDSENICNLLPGTYFHLLGYAFNNLNLKIGEVGEGSYFCFSTDSVITVSKDHPANDRAMVVDPRHIRMTIDFLLPE